MKKMEKMTKKRIRTFSTEFKKEKVQLIEEGKITVVQISKLYEVSRKAVYNWLKKYGRLPSAERMVIEKKSESMKNVELLKKIEELERVIGKQQVEILYKEEIIRLGSEIIGKDLEKKYNSQQSKD
ncbi:MAG: transposase [Saprospiraceae bacterium]|nr:transposase [Saprospiraceae bacterium]